jgi:hypothetical protein
VKYYLAHGIELVEVFKEFLSKNIGIEQTEEKLNFTEIHYLNIDSFILPSQNIITDT